VGSSFTKADAGTVSKSLAVKLIPTADKLRDLFTTFGLRRYVVSLIRTRWTGPVRGDGQEFVETAVPILPTPLITDLQGVTEVVNPAGLDEVGTILLQEVSASFSEEQLRGWDNQDNALEPNQDFFYEVEFVLPDGSQTVRRRFYPRGVPLMQPGRFQWVVRLERQRSDRTPAGEL